MQKEQFYNALSEPKEYLVPLRDELVQLSVDYPWFGASHVLLCKSDHIAGHVAFDANVKRAAIYAGEREALFDLIHKEDFSAKVKAFEEEIQRMDEEEAEHPEYVDDEDGSKEDGNECTEYEPEFELEGKEVPLEDASADSDPREAVVEEGESEELEARKKLEDFEGLQREILLEAISSSIEQEVQAEKSEKMQEGAPEEEKKDELAVPKTTNEEKKQLSSFAQFLQKRSHEIDWETAVKEDGDTDEEDQIPTQLEPDVPLEELIDRFIAADPKITPKKSALFSNENLAKLSLVEDVQFVTETMAKIYANQGAANKAIKAYKLLSLKYPEKSIYFANQIKKLQERRKSTK
ncbi:MAG: hypothetical protein ACJAU0_000089 [Flavobacteriales bacterium]|jgi:hypothetical protein